MSDHRRSPPLGRMARISGEIRAGAAPWELEVQRVLMTGGEVQPGDEALVLRLVAGAEFETERSRMHLRPILDVKRRARRFAYAAAAFAALFSVGVLAFESHLLRSNTPASPGPVSVASGVVAHEHPGAIAVGGRLVAPTPSAPADPISTPKAVESASVASVTSVASESAALLFASAKQAQRAGDTARALARFQRLEQRFSSSSEAQVSRVVSGSLWSSAGAPSKALAEYDAYLKRGGPLAEEALVGRARALAALGRSAEELGCWRALLARYPTSLYAARARARLARLQEPR